MTLKLLHLNILYGRYIDQLVNYLKDEDFDILCFQEVSGGRISATLTDNFEEIKTRLGYQGIRTQSWNLVGEKESYEANAIFYNPTFTITNKDIIYLKDYAEIPAFAGRKFQEDPRTVLKLELEKEGKRFRVVTTHLTWGPNSKDELHKLEQGKKLFEYMQTVDIPFILTGDFNVNASSQVVKWIDSLARNLTVENHITNTLNPRTHKATHLFPPGLAVDYIYVSDDVTVKDFHVVDEDISDHLGLYLTCEL